MHSVGRMQNFVTLERMVWNRHNAVGTATGYGLDGRGIDVRIPVAAKIFKSPRRPCRFWGPPSLLSDGYLGLLPKE
jgi:hypothetical protein